MTIRTLLASAALCALALPAHAEQAFPAKLAGHAYFPAMTLVAPPADAPRDAFVSGKFTGKARNDKPMTVPGTVGPNYGDHQTGLAVPFIGQPVQGMSGFAMNAAADGAIYALTDNGFGSKANSPDALLFFHKLNPDFQSGSVERQDTVFLRDPDRKVPFRIAYEGTDSRYLTGADFDPESIQVLGDEVWIGEEFGPSIIRASLDGTVKAVYQTELDGAVLKGPDTPGVTVPAAAGKDFKVQRSGGYEGMALQPGTNLLWAMLEKPLLGEDGKPEGNFLRVITFDTAKGAWTGKSFKFKLADGATAIGDFNFIDDNRALVIERDNGEGDAPRACAGDDKSACYPVPAKVKNIVLVDTSRVDDEGNILRIGTINLLDIQDPDGKAITAIVGPQAVPGKFSFPFFTIEDVRKVDDRHILVANDNNLPFSGGREIGKAANNEFILLEVADFLAAK